MVGRNEKEEKRSLQDERRDIEKLSRKGMPLIIFSKRKVGVVVIRKER